MAAARLAPARAGAPGAECLWPCPLCLSTERALSCVRDVSWAYGILKHQDQSAGAECEEAIVCWECKAELRRMLRFKRQALRARQLLEQVRMQPTHTMKCLSRLSITTKSDYDYTMSSTTEVGGKNINISNHVVENNFEGSAAAPKVQNELEHDDVWAEQLTMERPITDIVTVQLTRANVRKIKAKMKKETDCADNFETVYESKKDLMKRRQARLQSLKFMNHRFKCTECVEMFRTANKLAVHNRRLHCESAHAVTCDTCLCRLPSVADLAAHRASHQTYKCGRCRYTSPSLVKVKRHQETHSVTWSCDICEKRFKNKHTLHNHNKLHVNKQAYECDHCHKTYKSQIQIVRHLWSHTKRWLCDLCGKAFSNKAHLQAHSYAHLGASQRKFECPDCHNRYIDKFKLIVHMRSHTGEKPFKCDDCGKEYREKAQLVVHRKRNHSDRAQIATKNRKFERTKSVHRNKPFIPPKKKMESSVNEGNSIILVGNKTGFGENTETKIVSQMGVESQDKCRKKIKPKDYVCNICGKNFKERSNRLKLHLAVHSDERPYKCSECGMNFKYQSGLWTHQLLHKGVKYKCTICGSQFTQKGNMTAHLKIHLEKKAFQCIFCGNKFRTKRNLDSHCRVHTIETVT